MFKFGTVSPGKRSQSHMKSDINSCVLNRKRRASGRSSNPITAGSGCACWLVGVVKLQKGPSTAANPLSERWAGGSKVIQPSYKCIWRSKSAKILCKDVFKSLFDTNMKLQPSIWVKSSRYLSTLQSFQCLFQSFCYDPSAAAEQENTVHRDRDFFFTKKDCNCGRDPLYLTDSDGWSLMLSSDKPLNAFLLKMRTLFYPPSLMLWPVWTGGMIIASKTCFNWAPDYYKKNLI